MGLINETSVRAFSDEFMAIENAAMLKESGIGSTVWGLATKAGKYLLGGAKQLKQLAVNPHARKTYATGAQRAYQRGAKGGGFVGGVKELHQAGYTKPAITGAAGLVGAKALVGGTRRALRREPQQA